MYLAEDFLDYLVGYDVSELEATGSTVLGLRPDLTIGFHNTAWETFSEANDGHGTREPDKRPVLEVFAEPLRPFYADLFERARRSGVPQDHVYECSSPDLFRRFRMRVVPLARGALLVMHHLSEERPHQGRSRHQPHHRYVDNRGMITQCAHCRMVRRADEPATWDWVPAWVAAPPPNTSHGLCPICFRHYFPDAAASWDARKRG